MSAYLQEQLKKRRIKLLEIIPVGGYAEHLSARQGPRMFPDVKQMRNTIFNEWALFEEEIKNWIAVCWEGF
jgi:hypothetical protein